MMEWANGMVEFMLTNAVLTGRSLFSSSLSSLSPQIYLNLYIPHQSADSTLSTVNKEGESEREGKRRRVER